MTPAWTALVPVFLIILTGVLLRRVAPLSEEGWRGFGHVTYFVFVPALIIATLATADLSLESLTGIGASLTLAVAVAGALTLLTRAWVLPRLGGPAFTSIFQGAVRWNAFVALAVAGALFGDLGLSLTAIAFVVLMPGVNVASVWVLARDGRHDVSPTALGTLEAIAANPFLWSCAIGLLLSLVQEAIPASMMTTLNILGQAALGASLVMVGAGLHLPALARLDVGVAIGCVLKLLVLPSFAYAAGLALGLPATEMAIVLIAASVPTAPTAYVLAEKLGGDAPLMARIVTVQTLLAFVTMPLFIGLAV